MSKKPPLEWQRTTALSHVQRGRDQAAKIGEPISEQRLAAAAAGYVGATPEQVLAWMEAAR